MNEKKQIALESLKTSLNTGEQIPRDLALQICSDLDIKVTKYGFLVKTGSLHNSDHYGFYFKSLEMAIFKALKLKRVI